MTTEIIDQTHAVNAGKLPTYLPPRVDAAVLLWGRAVNQVRLSSVVWNASSVSISLTGCVRWFHLK